MSKNIEDILERKLDFVRDTPLDHFFRDLDCLFSKINKEHRSTSIYDDFGLNNAELVKLLSLKLRKLSELVNEKQGEDKDIIPISLHDMKNFDVLVSLLAIHGIDANISIPIGLSTNERRLESFKISDKIYDTPKLHCPNQQSLLIALDAFTAIFLDQKDNYLNKLLLKGGAGYMDTLIGYISLIYCTKDNIYEEKLSNLEAVADTYSLFQIYSLLVSSIKEKAYQQWPVRRLSLLTIERPDGLLSLIDFVLGVREDEQIDTSKFDRVNQIVAAKPSSVQSTVYFDKLFVQIYDGLVHVDKPILITCLNGIVTTFFIKNKRIVRDFLFSKIYRVLYNPTLEEYSAKELNDCINVLISLARTTYVAVIEDMVSGFNNGHQFYLNLWIYAFFLKKRKISPENSKEPYYNILLGLIRTYMTVTSDFKMLNVILLNLVNYEHEHWKYEIDFETQLPYIRLKKDNIEEEMDIHKEARYTQSLQKFQALFSDIDSGIELFIVLLKKMDNPSVTRNTFLAVVNNWIVQKSSKQFSPKSELGAKRNSDNYLPDKLQALIQLKLLEKINENFKSEILSEPADLLTVIYQLLSTFPKEIVIPRPVDSDDEEEESDNDMEDTVYPEKSDELTMVLDILSSVLESLQSDSKLTGRKILEEISKKLEVFTEDEKCQKVYERLQILLSSDAIFSDSDTNSVNKDRELLKKAISDLNDPLIPIRAHGLFELRQLLARKSSVIDPERVLLLHISQMHDQDPFIYLNVIRGINALIHLAPDNSLQTLFKMYRARTTNSTLDDVLKIGEVFINYVTEKGSAFRGPFASQLVEICLENVRDKETVDNRLRMSSMSILGVCLQVNATGIQGHIHDILDCVFGILTLERSKLSEEETIRKNSVIMRRSAIHLIYDLMEHSGLDLFPETYSPLKIKTTLSYVRSQERDYLTCEQIDNVLNQLEIQFQISLGRKHHE